MNTATTLKTLITIESTDWTKAIDGRDYAYVCPCHVDTAVALGFDGTQHVEQIEVESVFNCEICDGTLSVSFREWLLDAFSEDETQELIKSADFDLLICFTQNNYEGGLKAFIADSVPR